MLLYYAIQRAIEISKIVGVRYLILRPDGGKENEKLKSMEFCYMIDRYEWMYPKACLTLFLYHITSYLRALHIIHCEVLYYCVWIAMS